MVLSELPPEEEALITGVNGGYGFRKKMLNRGVVEGIKVRVLSRCGPITVVLNQQNTITLGRGMAERIEVRKRA